MNVTSLQFNLVMNLNPFLISKLKGNNAAEATQNVHIYGIKSLKKLPKMVWKIYKKITLDAPPWTNHADEFIDNLVLFEFSKNTDFIVEELAQKLNWIHWTVHHTEQF